MKRTKLELNPYHRFSKTEWAKYRDGTKKGFDLELTKAISDAVHVPVVASGGVGSLDDLVDGVRIGHASAVLAASIFHFGTFTIAEAKAHLEDHGIPMRMD